MRRLHVFAGLLVSGVCLAQEPNPTPPPTPTPAPAPHAQGPNPEQEMQRVFAEVESALREIDLLLSDAAAGDTSLSEVPDSGLDKLLEISQSRSKSVIQGIDKILELAEQSQQSSSNGGQPPPDSQDSPLDQRRSEENRDREQTPQGPQQQEQNQPQPEPGQQDEPQEQPGDQNPQDQDNQNDDPGQNRPGQENSRPGGDPSTTGTGVDAWGELPTRVRQVFRTEGGQDLPVQYRDWIDAYYRKLNETRRP